MSGAVALPAASAPAARGRGQAAGRDPDVDQGAEGRERLWLRAVAQAVLLLAPSAALAWFGWERRWVAEDAFIDLRVVQHLRAGHGPVFNLGERVEAYTNPLWVGLLAAAAALLHPILGEGLSLEWIAVWLGLLCSVGGLSMAVLATARHAGRDGRTGLALPLGAAVVVGIPAYWDFTTSGLETGLTLGWLGLSWWALTLARAPAAGSSRPFLVAALLGLGPLIRPDLALISAVFLIVHVLTQTGSGPPFSSRGQRLARSAALLVSAAALPGAYQVFRMGYFAALVPNTALAKEASAARWDQGWKYLADFVGAYWLWLPLGALLCWWLLDLTLTGRRRNWRRVGLTAAPVLAGALHGLYVVRVGGDFMHGRMLLPSAFALLLPVMAIAGPRLWHTSIPALIVLPWTVAGALLLRPPYHHAGAQPVDAVGVQGIADERAFYVRLSLHAHPITLGDYALAFWARDGHWLRELAGRGRTLLPTQQRAVETPPGLPPPVELPLAPHVTADVVANRRNIGLTGYAAGPRVHLVDPLGLADPIASRLKLQGRGRPGHEKELPDAWVIGRFAPAAALSAHGPDSAARETLGCGDLADLLRAVTAPMDASRFARNVLLAWRLSQLRVAADPIQARAELCGPPS